MGLKVGGNRAQGGLAVGLMIGAIGVRIEQIFSILFYITHYVSPPVS